MPASKTHFCQTTPKRQPSQSVGTFALLLIACCSRLLVGCSGDKTTDLVLDAAALLDRYEAQSRRHDPEKFVEVELGEFFVTRNPPKSSILLVRCQLFAVTPRENRVNLTNQLAKRGRRMRDTILGVIQKTTLDDLAEPSMNSLKSEIIPAVNKSLQTNAVRDVVFSELSIERA